LPSGKQILEFQIFSPSPPRAQEIKIVTHRNHLTVRIVDHIVHIDRLLNGVLHIGGGTCTAMKITVRVFVCLRGVNVCVHEYF